MEVAIIGYGVVGMAYNKIFDNAYIYDKVGFSDNKEDINKCDLGIICVPTPEGKNGKTDLSAIEDVLKWLETPLILIKSAVPPSTTTYLKKKYKKRICVSPEYVGESKYYIPDKYLDPTDPRKHPFQIFGGDKEDTKEIVDIFQEQLGPTVRYIQVSSETAELTKYMENCFFATKVTFCNEFYEIAKGFDVDYNELRECFIEDPRVCNMHTSVFKENRGFGGKCYPKDLASIISSSEKKGYKPMLLRQVRTSNNKFKKL